MRRYAILSLAALTFAGCMVGPDYVRPPVESPAAWRVADKMVENVANTAWWEQFGDPVLNDLVATALRENKDLLIASARIDEFAGQVRLRPRGTLSAGRCRRAAGRVRSTGETGNTLASGEDLTVNSYRPS